MGRWTSAVVLQPRVFGGFSGGWVTTVWGSSEMMTIMSCNHHARTKPRVDDGITTTENATLGVLVSKSEFERF